MFGVSHMYLTLLTQQSRFQLCLSCWMQTPYPCMSGTWFSI